MSPFETRRRRLMDELSPGLILVRGAAGDGRLNPSFFYLTGLAEPRGALLLAPGGIRVATGRSNPGRDYVHGRIASQLLFLPTADPMAARWGEDSVATTESIHADAVGVDLVLGSNRLESVLAQRLPSAESLFLVRGSAPGLGAGDDPDAAFAARVRDRFLDVRLRDATPAVNEMRRIKDEDEVGAIERAVAVTAEALDRILTRVKDVSREHEAEAEIAAVYRRRGATHAFDPIVGSGSNALLLHYRANSGPVRAGELLLIDTGAVLDGYRCDVTRTIPVGGRFDRRQREVYEVVLRALTEVIAECKPGSLLGDLHARAFDVIAQAGFEDHFPHGTSHHLGLETHDVGDVHRPLEPGCVITVEPGIYIPDENIGVRIEDDVLITAGGCRVLTEAIPRTIEEIERRMASA